MKKVFVRLCLLCLAALTYSCNEHTPATYSNVVTIEYIGNTVVVENPLQSLGVSVTVNGADVTVISQTDNDSVIFVLSGSTTDGMFKAYSLDPFVLVMDGLSLVNADGPAINIQARKGVRVQLAEGSENFIADGESYPIEIPMNTVLEEQSATFFSEGTIAVSGLGKLTIQSNGLEQHALASDDNITLDSASLVIAKSVKDGIHCNDGFVMRGGVLDIKTGGDGIDAGTSFVEIGGGQCTVRCDSVDGDAICCDSIITLTGGNVDLTVNGKQAKALKSDRTITLNNGRLQITATGGVGLEAAGEGFDPSYCTGIKSEEDVVIDGASVVIEHSGTAGKGISTGANFSLLSGSLEIYTSGNGDSYTDSLGLTDAYSAACISTNGNVDILGGTLIATSSGIGGKAISADGLVTIGSETGSPDLTLSTSGASVMLGSTSLTEPKVLKSESDVRIRNGIVRINAAGSGEGIDTKTSIFLSGGTLIAQGAAAGSPVRTFDYVTTFNVTGGTLIACGSYRSKIPMPSQTGSTQKYVYAYQASSAYNLPSGTLFRIQDASGNGLVTFAPKRNAYYVLFSSPAIQSGTTYSLLTGGTIDGSSENGYYAGGTYSGGSVRTSFSPVAIKTAVTFTN